MSNHAAGERTAGAELGDLDRLVLVPLLAQLKWATSHDTHPDQFTRNIAEFISEAEKGRAALRSQPEGKEPAFVPDEIMERNIARDLRHTPERGEGSGGWVMSVRYLVKALAGARAALREAANPPAIEATVSELRAGEENEGPLESTDLFIVGRGVSLLCNVKSGEAFTYSLSVDNKHVQGGTVGAAALASPREPQEGQP